MNLAKIEVTHTVIHPTGRFYRTYKWIGKRDWPILIDCMVDLEDLPFKLHLIEPRYDIGGGLYIRKDAFLPFGWAIVIKYKARDAYWIFFNKFMATLNIWELAYTPHGAVPSWKDIGKKQNETK